jgi:hypothetical protein
MSRGMHPKIGDEHILLGFNRGLYTTSKEKQSHPDDLAESYMNTLSINIRKRGSMLRILPKPELIKKNQEIRAMTCIMKCPFCGEDAGI